MKRVYTICQQDPETPKEAKTLAAFSGVSVVSVLF